MYKIYKLLYNNDVVYVGRTKRNINDRKRNGYPRNPELNKIYKFCDIELIEETDDKSREMYWISFYKSDKLLNILKGRTKTDSEICKNWRDNNKEHVKQYTKEYRIDNDLYKDYQCTYHKQYREKNREILKEYQRQYYLKRKKSI